MDGVFQNLKTGKTDHVKTRFVFIGAGGAAVKLLQLTGLPEAKQYAGFPVGGEFLITDNPAITAQHTAKVYGRAELGAPPMSVPHIDTRYIDGKNMYCLDHLQRIQTSSKMVLNLTYLRQQTKQRLPMTTVGLENLDLVKYLVSQVMMSDEDRLNELRKYYPDAKAEDWRLSQGGQRVQIIKRTR